MVKLILRILGTLLLSACSALPPSVDTVLDTTPETAAAAGWLAGHLGLSKPVQVEDGDLLKRGYYGYSQDLGDRYLVVLDHRLEPDAKVMVLLHELAHLVHWERGLDGGDHGPGWGEAYAEVFRLWVGENVQDE